MTWRGWVPLAACVVGLLGCGDPQTLETSSPLRSAIKGGTEDTETGFPQVYFLRITLDTGMRFGCTATLITPRTLLTAAHCFDAALAGASSVTVVEASNTATAPDAGSPLWLPGSNPVRHPMWNGNDRHRYDIGLAQLDEPSTATPVPYNRQGLISADVGAPLTVVGFGITAMALNDFGKRRVVSLPMRSFDSTHIYLGNHVDKGICNGDSGGPSFRTFADGIRRVAGIHSFSNPSEDCVDGEDTRVDAFATFVRDYLNTHGGPTCVEDGLCATANCTPIDPDCKSAATTPADAGTSDGGMRPPPPPPSGCGCTFGAPLGWLWLLGAFETARRLKKHAHQKSRPCTR